MVAGQVLLFITIKQEVIVVPYVFSINTFDLFPF